MAGSFDTTSLSSSAASQHDAAVSNGADMNTSKQARSRFKSAATKLKHKFSFKSHETTSHPQPAAEPAISRLMPLADIQARAVILGFM